MFGTIKPCKKQLPPEQNAAYKQHYCGLCFALQENFGKYASLLLNYDLTNDYLLSGSARDDGRVQTGVCPWSLWRRKVSYITYPELSDYYARLNYILVYYNLMDDVHDDGSLVAKLITGKMEKQLKNLDDSMRNESTLLQNYLQELSHIEQQNQALPVMQVAHLFGQLLKDMVKPPFVFGSDEEVFSEINYWVGIWVYTMDAIIDCLSDGMKKHYNPILAGKQGTPLGILRGRKQELLGILKKCRENILQLLEVYPTYENGQLLRHLFRGELPKIVCIYLEVEKNEIISQSEAETSGGLQ